MMSFLPIAMLCIGIAVLGALITLLVILLKPQKKKSTSAQNASTGNISGPRKNSWAWILFFGIALVLVLWSIWIALFFLAVVLVMRRDPKPYHREIPYPSDLDRDSAKGIYTWLLLSPFLTVPALIVASFVMDYSSSTNERVFGALIPVVFHLPLLFLLNSKRPFVYRHAQEAIFLVALRAATASIAFSIGNYPGDGAWFFFLGNGALWLFGSLWARGQAVRRECWWMAQKGETIIAIESHSPVAAQYHLEQSHEFIGQYKKTEALQHALAAFRTGDREMRSQAVQVLSTLDEVETF
jgi:NADH:ubiquinone oxidoreductase subunit 3 (subunit A)